jgi:tetratricopeptide (TPR) repeat protein
MANLSPLKLDRMRRRILSGDSSEDYLVTTGKHYLEQRPDDVPVLEALAPLSIKSGDLLFADHCLRTLMDAGSRDEEKYIQRMDVLSRMGNVNEGRRFCAEARKAVKSEAGLSMLQNTSAALGSFDITKFAAEKLLKKNKSSGANWSGLGTSKAYAGELPAAEAAFRKALQKNGKLTLTRFLLSSCRSYSSDDNNLADLRLALSDEKPDTIGWQRICYSLAKELEDCGEYDEAFEWYSHGAHSVRKGFNYSTDTDKRNCELLLRLFDLPGNEGVSGKVAPLFVLGMPRTGSTLLERMLTGHSRIVSQGETHALLYSLTATLGRQGAGSAVFQRLLAEAKQVDYQSIGRRYLDFVEPALDGAAYFIDKRPQNVFFAGLILRAFPEARIIYTDRNPMDTCFSNFKHLFNPGFFPYSYDLIETAEHYLQVKQFADSWCERYPDRILPVNYDDLVENPRPVIDGIADFLGLESEDSCYAPEKNATGLSTGSFSQARQPIYRSSSRHWKNFETQLEGLRAFFDENGVSVEE